MALLENAGQLRRPRRAMCLANQELGRGPARVARDVLVDEIGEPIRVRDDPVKLIGRFPRRRAAEARRLGKRPINFTGSSRTRIGSPISSTSTSREIDW